MPDNNITRAEAVAILNNVLGRSADKTYVDSNSDTFAQYTDISNDKWYYYDMIEAAYAHDYEKTADGETWN